MNYDVVRARKTNRVVRLGRYERREGKREACWRKKGRQKPCATIWQYSGQGKKER